MRTYYFDLEKGEEIVHEAGGDDGRVFHISCATDIGIEFDRIFGRPVEDGWECCECCEELVVSTERPKDPPPEHFI